MAASHCHREWCACSRLSDRMLHPNESVWNMKSGSHTRMPSTRLSDRTKYSGTADAPHAARESPDLLTSGKTASEMRAAEATGAIARISRKKYRLINIRYPRCRKTYDPNLPGVLKTSREHTYPFENNTITKSLVQVIYQYLCPQLPEE